MRLQHGDPLGKTGLAGQSELQYKRFVAVGSVGGLRRGTILLREDVRPHTMQQARKLAADFRFWSFSFIPHSSRI
jgi:hypothetical protein